MRPTRTHRPVPVAPSQAGAQCLSPARRWLPACAGLTALLALAGCGSIGQGSTIQSLEIRLASTNSAVAPVALHRCLRDQLIVVATFTDGTTADFSLRAQWTSSDESVVRVSNGDIPLSILSSGNFVDSTVFFHRAGTIVPQAASGTATITASFVGLSASMPVNIATADFKVAALAEGVLPHLAPTTQYLGPGTGTRFAFYVVDSGGRTLTSAALNQLDTQLNPVRWDLVGGEFDPRDTAVTDDFDKYAVPTAADPVAVVNVGNGTVTAIKQDPGSYQVRATTSLCPADPVFQPTADLRVVPFDVANPITLAHEADFIAPGVPGNGDLVAGTNELLRITANLDSDGDGVGDQTQDLVGQADLSITHTTTCTEGSANCTCDTGGVNCTKRLVLNPLGSAIQTLVTDDSAGAVVSACFTTVDRVHSDDCEEIAGGDSGFTSNPLVVQAIAVDLGETGATVTVEPAAPAAERALTYPGRQFQAYGSFTAREGTPFAGGTSATGTQKVSRFVGWTTRPQGSTTEFFDKGFVNNLGDGFFLPLGAFTYLRDVTENTAVDVSITPRAPLTEIPAPDTPTPFTICPRLAGSCP